MFQQSTAEAPGNERAHVIVSQTAEANTNSVTELPKSYTEVAPTVLPNKTETRSQLQPEVHSIKYAIKEELKAIKAGKCERHY